MINKLWQIDYLVIVINSLFKGNKSLIADSNFRLNMMNIPNTASIYTFTLSGQVRTYKHLGIKLCIVFGIE